MSELAKLRLKPTRRWLGNLNPLSHAAASFDIFVALGKQKVAPFVQIFVYKRARHSQTDYQYIFGEPLDLRVLIELRIATAALGNSKKINYPEGVTLFSGMRPFPMALAFPLKMDILIFGKALQPSKNERTKDGLRINVQPNLLTIESNSIVISGLRMAALLLCACAFVAAVHWDRGKDA